MINYKRDRKAYKKSEVRATYVCEPQKRVVIQQIVSGHALGYLTLGFYADADVSVNPWPIMIHKPWTHIR